MKHFTLKLFLLIACLCGATSVWAETTTLYERGTTTNWADEDLTDWTAVTATSTAINEGIVQIGTNAAYSVTKSLDEVTENSIVTLTASLTAGKASGRDVSYDYVRIGGIELRLYGQASVAKIAKDGTDVATLSGFSRNDNYNVTFVVNQASGEITYEVSGGTSGTGKVTSTTAVTNVVVGHNRGGRENYETSVTLKSIKIEEEVQTVATADYIINYVFAGETIKTVEGSSVVGGEVVAENPVTINEVKYYAQAGKATSLVLVNGENVLNVNLRLADNYNYTVNATDGENVLNTISTGTVVEGESAYVYYPQFILNGTNLREIANNASGDYYGTTITPDADNYVKELAYVKSAIENVVFYVEGENIEGASKATNLNRASNGYMGFATEDLTLTTLEPGIYKIYVRGVNGNSAARSFSFKNGDNELFADAIPNGTNYLKNSDEITITETTQITFSCAGSSASGMDWIYIQRTGDFTISKSISAAGYATLYSDKALDFTNVEGLKAYIITAANGDKLTTQEVTKIPAYTGVLLEGKAGTYDIPVAASAEPVKDNLFEGVLEATEKEAGIYVLMNSTAGVGFYKTSNTFTVGAGTAYLPADIVPAEVKALRINQEGTTTIQGIDSEVNEANAEIYNLAGQRVAAPTRGIYVINGKKVMVK